jgi:hypothetical protein
LVIAGSLLVSTLHTVAALPRWEPETVNRKGFQVTKSLEASPTLKKLEVGGLKGLSFRNTKQVLGSFATH